jgi:hypothetical protein
VRACVCVCPCASPSAHRTARAQALEAYVAEELSRADVVCEPVTVRVVSCVVKAEKVNENVKVGDACWQLTAVCLSVGQLCACQLSVSWLCVSCLPVSCVRV